MGALGLETHAQLWPGLGFMVQRWFPKGKRGVIQPKDVMCEVCTGALGDLSVIPEQQSQYFLETPLIRICCLLLTYLVEN